MKQLTVQFPNHIFNTRPIKAPEKCTQYMGIRVGYDILN